MVLSRSEMEMRKFEVGILTGGVIAPKFISIDEFDLEKSTFNVLSDKGEKLDVTHVKDIGFGNRLVCVKIRESFPLPTKNVSAFVADIYDVRIEEVLCKVGETLMIIPKEDIIGVFIIQEGSKILNERLKEYRVINQIDNSILTGGKVNYYEAVIPYEDCKIDEDATSVIIEAESLINSLKLNWSEGNIMKELFRTANGRIGNGKKGHTEKYGAEKIAYYGNANLKNLERKEDEGYE